jgi:hypothetical protein
MTTFCVTSPKKPEKLTQQQMKSVHKLDNKIQNCSAKIENDARILTALAVNKKPSEAKQNHCEGPTDLRPAASKSGPCKTKCKLNSVQLSQQTTTAHLRQLTKGSVKSVQKARTKHSSDITKYILKTREVTDILTGTLIHTYFRMILWPYLLFYIYCFLVEETSHRNISVF